MRSQHRKQSIGRICLGLCLSFLLPGAAAAARDGPAVWDNRCHECHGDSTEFASKYLWDVDGTLQGRHHVEDLKLFMRNHYIPKHEIPVIREMLLAKANRMARFAAECGECHGDAAEFVKRSIWVRKDAMTGLETGKDVGEFLPTHQGLKQEDVEFYLRLLARVAP